MNHHLFRKKTLEKISSPDQLNDYIHISTPSAWVVVAAFTVLLIGVCIWGIFGHLDATLPVVAVKTDDGVVCCVKEADYEKIRIGMTVSIDDEEFLITDMENVPIPAKRALSEYAMHVGNLTDGEWIYHVYTNCNIESQGEVFAAKIMLERIHPLYFVTN